MKVSKIMNTSLAIVRPEASFRELICALRRMPSRLLHVTDEKERLIGVIASYDILKVMLPFWLDSGLARAVPDDEAFIRRILEQNRTKTARDLMTEKFYSLRPEDNILEAEALFKEKAMNVLPVLDAEGKCVGEVGRAAVLAYLVGLFSDDCLNQQ